MIHILPSRNYTILVNKIYIHEIIQNMKKYKFVYSAKKTLYNIKDQNGNINSTVWVY